MLTMFDLPIRLGTRVIEIPGLPHALIYVPEGNIALIRTGLDVDAAVQCADRLLAELACRLGRTEPAS